MPDPLQPYVRPLLREVDRGLAEQRARVDFTAVIATLAVTGAIAITAPAIADVHDPGPARWLLAAVTLLTGIVATLTVLRLRPYDVNPPARADEALAGNITEEELDLSLLNEKLDCYEANEIILGQAQQALRVAIVLAVLALLIGLLLLLDGHEGSDSAATPYLGDLQILFSR